VGDNDVVTDNSFVPDSAGRSDQADSEWPLVSRELTEDLMVWAADWLTRSGEPAHDADAAALIRRLREETQRRYQFAYQP